MVKMQMRQHNRIDLVFRDTHLSQTLQEQMISLFDAVALAQLGLKERTDARFKEHTPAPIPNQKRPALQQNPIVFVGLCQFLPHGLWCIAKHGTTIKSLTIALDGIQLHQTAPYNGLKEHLAEHFKEPAGGISALVLETLMVVLAIRYQR
jgi:hypothetical protein